MWSTGQGEETTERTGELEYEQEARSVLVLKIIYNENSELLFLNSWVKAQI